MRGLVMGVVLGAGWLGLSGCAHHVVGYSPIGSMTVRVAPDQEADVVWLIKAQGETGGTGTETVLRCHNAQTGPVCVAAKEGTQ